MVIVASRLGILGQVRRHGVGHAQFAQLHQPKDHAGGELLRDRAYPHQHVRLEHRRKLEIGEAVGTFEDRSAVLRGEDDRARLIVGERGRCERVDRRDQAGAGPRGPRRGRLSRTDDAADDKRENAGGQPTAARGYF